ncbi:MAG: hypothetical protein ACE5DR_04265 [Thermodesulfobacteriota bacterium]
MIKKKMMVILICLALSPMLQAPSKALARPFQILDDVILVDEDDGCRFIEVGFNVPMRYIKHFPYEKGKDLRIQLEPLNIIRSDPSAQFRREYPGSLSNELSQLADVVFEGDVEGGPFLAVFFHDSHGFKVGQGGDFRSLIIGVSAGGETPCEPTP